jgi:phage terminase large subunit GpA-like protein
VDAFTVGREQPHAVRRGNSEPGPYNLDRTPYWRAVMDAAADPFVEEIDCLKGAQIGWSEVCRNVFGYWVDLDPGR